MESKIDLWTPLNCLVDAANKTKSSKSNPQGGICSKTEPTNALNCQQLLTEGKPGAESTHAPDVEACALKSKYKEHAQNTKVQDDKSQVHLLQKWVVDRMNQQSYNQQPTVVKSQKKKT